MYRAQLLPIFLGLWLSIMFFPTVSYSEELNQEQQKKIEQAKQRRKQTENKIYQAKRSSSVRIYPDIITNLATDPDRKFSYIQIRIDLILFKRDDIEFVELNQPLIRDGIILFLNKQNPLNFATPQQQSSMEKRIVDIANNALLPEVNRAVFKSVIIQKINIE